jgi:hypothetical protein
MSFISPPDPARGFASEEMAREQEQELERKAERYAQLHAGDDDAERKSGIVARILNRLRRR